MLIYPARFFQTPFPAGQAAHEQIPEQFQASSHRAGLWGNLSAFGGRPVKQHLVEQVDGKRPDRLA
jgi:hypothetical protein